ncbi:MAG: DinB family protein [Actinobacteria bacterium]|nr:DinB family protein [Actinomycetota bacterium]
MTTPDGITPDTKDWTWVLERPCPECGFVAATLDPLAVGGAIRASLPRWHEALGHPGVRQRPRPDTWSPLEYAAHVHDVFHLFHQRLALVLTETNPTFEDWDQDAAAAQGHYAEQDPADLADRLVTAGERIAISFDTVTTDQLERTGQRSDGVTFTVESLGKYLLHEVVHHLRDVDA